MDIYIHNHRKIKIYQKPRQNKTRQDKTKRGTTQTKEVSPGFEKYCIMNRTELSISIAPKWPSHLIVRSSNMSKAQDQCLELFHESLCNLVDLLLLSFLRNFHDDVIKRKHFLRYWPFVWGIHRSPVNSPHKGQWRGALMFSLICAWINYWVYNRTTDDLRRHRAHCDVIVMRSDVILATMSSKAYTIALQDAKFWKSGNLKFIKTLSPVGTNYNLLLTHCIYIFCVKSPTYQLIIFHYKFPYKL